MSLAILMYETFLKCFRENIPEPDTTLPDIVYSPVIDLTSYTTVLKSSIRNRRFNNISTPKPAIIITPTKYSHVQAAVLSVKKLGLQLKIRSGGHDYDGLSYVSNEKNYIVLDMQKLNKVNVDINTETAFVEAGAQLGALYYHISQKSKVHGFPAGVCPTVGVGGHLSGGGYGTMLRKFGTSVDQVIDAQIVDVHGRVLDRKSMGEDLFWAIRGGGGASFGVVLSYTVKIVRIPEISTVFKITKQIEENAIDLVYKWQLVAPIIDVNLFIRIMIMPVAVNNRKTHQATFVAHFLGDSSRLLSVMSEKFPELGVKKEDCLELSWARSVLYWANLDHTVPTEILLDRHSDTVNYLIRKSDYVQTPIMKSGWGEIFEKMMELGQVGLYLNPYGGKMNEIAEDAVPFPHRAGNLFKIQYSTNWVDDDPKLEGIYMTQTRTLYAFMTRFVSKNPRCSFLCYRDLDIGTMVGNGESSYNSGKVYGEKYFKSNFHRLVKVKTKADPDNFFRNEQSIPVLHVKAKL
ncbi:berberine bridge enzyme-like protein 21 [Tanacetum coccineum]